MRKNSINSKVFAFILLTLFSVQALAQAATGVGGVASSLMSPVSVLSDFMNSAALAIGISCLFASLLKYLQHRKNKMATPISTVIVLFVVGAFLVCLPLVSHLTESGIPYSLHIF